MSVLSITFHTTENTAAAWELYMKNDLYEMVENLMDAEKYILSDVHSDMINEGKNTNLLLFFADAEKREDFVEIELTNISERIHQKFHNEVMIFKTYLNPYQSRP